MIPRIEYRKAPKGVSKPPSRHWGTCRVCAGYWVARVSLNLIAAAARGIGPTFWILAIIIMAYVAIEVAVLQWMVN